MTSEEISTDMLGNEFNFLGSLMVDIDQEIRDIKHQAKEYSPNEQILRDYFVNTEYVVALEEEFELLENAEENIRHQLTEKQKNLLKIKQDGNFHSNSNKNKKDHEKQLKKTVQSLKKEIEMLKENPLTEKDEEKLAKCKKKLVLYEKCTGVVFDFSSKDPIKGFVQNPGTNYLSTFSVEKNSDVAKALWIESTKAGGLNCPLHSSNNNPNE